MEFCYGELNNIRVLEEAEFWKRQESEHTVVIKEIASNLEKNVSDKLTEYKNAFDSAEAILVQYLKRLNRSDYKLTPSQIKEIRDLIEITEKQSQSFINFLTNLIAQNPAIKDNPVAVTIVNHIIRESEYYIGIAKAFLNLEKKSDPK